MLLLAALVATTVIVDTFFRPATHNPIQPLVEPVGIQRLDEVDRLTIVSDKHGWHHVDVSCGSDCTTTARRSFADKKGLPEPSECAWCGFTVPSEELFTYEGKPNCVDCIGAAAEDAYWSHL